jgi:peptidoglycan/LPS O-acetylase OafA/YrhL
VAITLPLAAASWYLFESPILSLKRRWPMASRPREARTPVTARGG